VLIPFWASPHGPSCPALAGSHRQFRATLHSDSPNVLELIVCLDRVVILVLPALDLDLAEASEAPPSDHLTTQTHRRACCSASSVIILALCAWTGYRSRAESSSEALRRTTDNSMGPQPNCSNSVVARPMQCVAEPHTTLRCVGCVRWVVPRTLHRCDLARHFELIACLVQ
jgi:hypothetical protein